MKKQSTKQSKMQKIKDKKKVLSPEEVAKNVEPESFVANYDATTFEYEDFWKNREYEHLAEYVLLRQIFDRYIYHNKHYHQVTFLDLGGGFGRLTPVYSGRGWLSILGDYSVKELIRAVNRMEASDANIATHVVALNAYALPFQDEVFDYMMSVRLIHHIKYVDRFFKEVSRVLRPGGIFVLEAAHKNHIKYVINEYLKRGDFSFFKEDIKIIEHDPKQSTMDKKDEGKKVSIMYNYSFRYIKKTAEKYGFKLLNKYPCSYFRDPSFKESFSTKTLLMMEAIVRKFFKFLKITPSIFYVFKKEGKNPYRNPKYDGKIVTPFEDMLMCPTKKWVKGKISKKGMQVKIKEDGRILCIDKNGKEHDFGYRMNRYRILDLRYPRPDNINF